MRAVQLVIFPVVRAKREDTTRRKVFVESPDQLFNDWWVRIKKLNKANQLIIFMALNACAPDYHISEFLVFYV